MTGSALDAERLWSLASGYGDPAALDALCAGQIGKRRLLLVAVARQAPGGADWVDAAVDLLARAEAAVPQEAGTVLGHPHVDSWASRCLHRLRTDPAGAGTDLGYLGALAAAAATRAGLDFSVELPCPDGEIWLPTLGTARRLGRGSAVVRGDAGRVEVVGADRSVRVPAAAEEPDPDWYAVRRLTVGTAGSRLTLEVDDQDPYRNCYPWAPEPRLPEAALVRLRDLLDEAWQWITVNSPEHATAIQRLVRVIVPVRRSTGADSVSAAARTACGAIALSMPDSAEVLALLLIHELQHLKLGALMDLTDLHHRDRRGHYHAPWRIDPRPVEALLQGTYAHLGVTDFWRMRRRDGSGSDNAAHVEFAHSHEMTRQAIAGLAGCGELTERGAVVVAAMAQTVRTWEAEGVPVAVAAGVRDISHATTARWRLRNLRPEPGEIADLVADWRARVAPTRTAAPEQSEAPTPTATATAEPAVWAGLVGVLRRTVIAPHRVDPVAAHLDEADRAYLAGAYRAAADGYRRRIERDPVGDEDAWIGLTLALGRLGQAQPAGALWQRPDLVRAVYAELSRRGCPPGSPGVLAAWLDTGQVCGGST